jgi:hypothetical protein
MNPVCDSTRNVRPDQRVLVFDCHEAWVYQLRLLPWPLDIVIGLRGRHTQGWDDSVRPVPEGARLISLDEALRAPEPYHCIVTHNLSDLLDCKTLAGPRLLVLHERQEGAAAEQGLKVPLAEVRAAVARFVELSWTEVLAVSARKGRSWGFGERVVPFCADPADYLPWRGELAAGLRVANQIAQRPRTLLWEFHQEAFAGLSVTIVGRNPEWPGVRPSADWQELKEIFARHRFYIHTADPELEDGYNMATLEAMAAGLPVLGNVHPSSPVEHGVSGFLSDDPAELRAYAQRLLDDHALAAAIGEAAQKVVAARFGPQCFARDFGLAIAAARERWFGSTSAEQSAREKFFVPART